MKREVYVFIFAVSLLVPGLTGGLHSVASAAPEIKQLTQTSGNEKMDEDPAKKPAAEAKMVIVARVNGAEINMFMLVRAMNRVAPKYAKKGEAATPETTEKIRKEALDALIFEELAVQDAIKKGINPTPEAIEKVVAEVKKNLGTEQAYKEYLDKNNLTEDALKRLIERSRRYEQTTAKEVYGKVKVDEKLVHEEYEKEKGKFILPDNFVAEDVFFLQGKDEETTREKTDKMLETIRKNDNDVYRLVLDGTFIVRKITVRKETYPEIYKTMTELKVGDLSGVIKERDGFHIIRLVKKEPSRQATFEEARSTIELKFLVPAQELRRQQWEKELRENAKIEIVLDDVGNNIKEGAGNEKK